MIKKLKRKIKRNISIIKSEFLIQKVKRFINNDKLFHINKIEKILAAKELFDIDTFIETGTYLGVTTNYVKNYFKRLFSIELSKILADEARQYFINKKHIEILQGDSGLLIEKIIKNNNSKKLFWLDAHYSAGITEASTDFGHTPISKELDIVLNNWVHNSVILIDDARLFNGTDNYPRVDDLITFVKSKDLNLKVFIDKDIIHIL
jgi:hypothetical protein